MQKKPNLQFLLTTSKIENVYALETGKFRFDSRILRFSDYNEPSKILGFVLRVGRTQFMIVRNPLRGSSC